MKKIGLWMAALTAVTVGGVYANFVYSDSEKMNTSMSDTPIRVTDGVEEGAAGVLNVNAEGLSITIDSAMSILGDQLGTTDAHTAMIQASGQIVVTFTPRDGLQESDILNNGIHAKIYFKGSWQTKDADTGAISGDWTYNWAGESDTPISVLSVNTTEIEIHQVDEDQEYCWTKEGNKFTFTITADQLFGTNGQTAILGDPLLVMNNIVLGTYGEYEAFEESFGSKNLEAYVSAVPEHDSNSN